MSQRHRSLRAGLEAGCALQLLSVVPDLYLEGLASAVALERSADVSLLKFHSDMSGAGDTVSLPGPHPQGWLDGDFGAKEAASLWVYFWMTYLRVNSLGLFVPCIPLANSYKRGK